ncbi:hypothetical protein JQ581_30150 [Bradyrhizobium liaoningense]|uniref:hypothetical protein n=1 Tax=Bradyrhizobium liaoningense TaxID=43992 RepID=UPI001BAC0EEB|nr:hypothetical protein [Bradyrhizobium liaoningense]MBR0741203.1 hypothetical protein [Bradyrhizobium liaoningense]
MSDDNTIKAPWTAAQVLALNRWQHSPFAHPFTCGGKHGQQTALFAHITGWMCPLCDYRQDWAHGYMCEDPSDMVISVEQLSRDELKVTIPPALQRMMEADPKFKAFITETMARLRQAAYQHDGDEVAIMSSLGARPAFKPGDDDDD